MEAEIRVHSADVVVVGSEGAGARAAIEAAREGLSVAVLTKGQLGRSGATLTAGTDIDVDSKSCIEVFGLNGDPRDSKDLFFEDVVIEGGHVNDQDLVQVHVDEAAEVVKECADWGMRIHGLWRAAGHRYPRGILSYGREVTKSLINGLKPFLGKEIKLFEDHMALEAVMTDGQVAGLLALDLRTGEIVRFDAKVVILATGGAQRLYPYTSAPEELTGEGPSIALKAGAKLLDMEFVQFLTCYMHFVPNSFRSVNTALVQGAWLINAKGQRFMHKWDPEFAEGTTRDNLAIGIMNEILEGRGWREGEGGYVLCHMAHQPKALLEYYTQNKVAASPMWQMPNFMDRITTGFKCFPASHFFCGGVLVDVDARSTVPGLFAAGESSGGLNGANRISGNAITQVLVQGRRAGRAAAQYCRQSKRVAPNKAQIAAFVEKAYAPLNRTSGESPIKVKKTIQRTAWESASPVRDAQGLQKAIASLADLRRNIVPKLACKAKDRVMNREWMEALETEGMALTLESICRGALAREESRGVHYRRDFPKLDNAKGLFNTITELDGDTFRLSRKPATIRKVRP
jgi:succinate dehydrogenase/fumarate reductase flavoprotein subunit